MTTVSSNIKVPLIDIRTINTIKLITSLKTVITYITVTY